MIVLLLISVLICTYLYSNLSKDNTSSDLLKLIEMRKRARTSFIKGVRSGIHDNGYLEYKRSKSLSASIAWRARYSSYWSQFCFRRIVTVTALHNIFEGIISTLTVLLEQISAPFTRTKVLKQIASICELNTSLFNRKRLQSVICRRLSDPSILVREECVKLVGQCIWNEPQSNFANKKLRTIDDWYLEELVYRLRDKGVSVRKTVVNILKDILLGMPSHPKFAFICKCLLETASMPTEENSVKEVIRATFAKLWFSSGISKEGQNLVGALNPSRDLSGIEHSALQIVDVISIYRCTDWLVDMIRVILHGSLSSDAVIEKEDIKRRRLLAHEHCEQIVSTLVECLVKTEEGSPSIVQRLQLSKSTGASFIVDIVSAIEAFCEVNLCSDFAVYLF
jgi:hypothetical protein